MSETVTNQYPEEEQPDFASDSRFEVVRAIDEGRFLRYAFDGAKELIKRNRSNADKASTQS